MQKPETSSAMPPLGPEDRLMRQYELVESVRAYDPAVNEDALNRAYVFAMTAHGSQRRASGHSAFSHPVAVATILINLRMDATSIAVSLLHDTVEDTAVTLADIRKIFDPDDKEIAMLVDGLTRDPPSGTPEIEKAEYLRKLILATDRFLPPAINEEDKDTRAPSGKDMRVLVIKVADRLHNMQTLHYRPYARARQKTVAETLEIYLPLARLLGMKGVEKQLALLANIQWRMAEIDTLIVKSGKISKEQEKEIAVLKEEIADTRGIPLQKLRLPTRRPRWLNDLVALARTVKDPKDFETRVNEYLRDEIAARDAKAKAKAEAGIIISREDVSAPKKRGPAYVL